MTTNLPEVIEDREILHRADAKGDRICRVQRIRFNNRITTANFWYSETGKLLRVTDGPSESLPVFSPAEVLKQGYSGILNYV